MEIRIIAPKQRIAYAKACCTLTKNSGKKMPKERLVSFFELMFSELTSEIEKKAKGEIANENK